MMKKVLVVAIAAGLFTALPAHAQHGGHGGHSGGSGHVGHSGMGGPAQTTPVLHATPEQMNAVGECIRRAEAGHHRAEKLIFLAGGEQLDVPEIKSELAKLESDLANAHEQHQKLLATFTEEQRRGLEGSLRKVDNAHAQVKEQFSVLTLELAGTTPDVKRVRKSAKQINSAMADWHKRHSEIARNLGIEN